MEGGGGSHHEWKIRQMEKWGIRVKRVREKQNMSFAVKLLAY